MSEILIPEVFKIIFDSDKTYYWIDGGRLGGKSNNSAIIGILMMLGQPYRDIIVARVSYGALGDSSYAEISHALESFPDFEDEFEFKKSPLRIQRRNNAGTIYFLGYGGSNTSRTKSIRPKHKIIMVILEETQELKDKRNLDEALASFRRHFGNEIKVLILGNPPPQEAHWFNRTRIEKENDPDWECLRVTYLDIIPFINDFDLKEIRKTLYLDKNYHDWFYLGETTASFGSVYPMLKKNRHVITKSELNYIMESSTLRPIGCVIGADGAVNRDSTAFVPYILMNNGQSIIAPIFYHNPKDDGVMGYHQLVQYHVCRWFDEICGMFHLGTRQEIRMHPQMNRLPIWMNIDNAAPDLIHECKFFLGDRADIHPTKKGTVMQMVSTVQSALCNDNIIIVDYGGYYDYVRNQFIKKDMNLLFEQWSLLTWNEKQDNYDPIVPNDVSDAGTYGAIFWYRNQENIQVFNLMKANNMVFKKISDILKEKR